MKIGVLAVQGDFSLHRKMLDALSIENVAVRTPQELAECDGLILPGGESTTFYKLLEQNGLFSAIREFAREHVIFGTCAGLITVARHLVNSKQPTLDLIDISVERNAYGRQIASFIDDIEVCLNGHTYNFEAVFIRAPLIRSVGAGVSVLSRHRDEIVMAENERVLAATFHPELTDNTLIHRYFVSKVERALASNPPQKKISMPA